MILEISDMGGMEKSAADFSRTGDDADRVMSSVIREIDGLGPVWGGDAPGQAFWSAYRGSATTTVANASQVGYQVQALGSNTTVTVAMYQQNEATGAALSGGISA